ncbi:phosphotransferase [Burkholderia cepacia]|uniref:phosphotransferase n=1 Tax=Burkholderia cepacia TaxID=292 RepID=UPI002AB5DF49|nr:phosphotransferase [Burkholderia cepacia]
MLTNEEQELRKRTEQAVSAYLFDAYKIEGNVSTVVKGANWTLAVNDGAQVFAYVRLYRTSGRSPVDVASELTVLRAVQATAALDVSRPFEDHLRRASSERELPDGTRRLIAVFARAAGREMAATTADFRRVGTALADLHRQSALAGLAPQREILGSGTTDLETIAMIADRSAAAAAAISRAMGDLERQGANEPIGPAGFCHGDVRPANLRIDGERVSFFDFDDCGTGPQWLDVAAMALWLEVFDYDDPSALWRAFLGGYGLAGDERQSLFIRWLVARHQLRLVRFLFDYCELDAALWEYGLNRASMVIGNAARDQLRALSRLSG